MMSELKKLIENDKVIFGSRECVKKANKISRVIIPNDARAETLKAFKEKDIEVEMIDSSKNEIMEKLELEFLCEAIGVKK